MPANPQAFDSFTPRRKKPNLVSWLLFLLGACVLLAFAWIAWQWLPGPAIRVAPETTYVTEPLGPDGLPDYEKWLLGRLRSGITPENNAGVLIYQATWPGELEPHDYRMICDELGLSEIPSEDDSLPSFYDKQLNSATKAWLKTHGINSDDEMFAEDTLRLALDASWRQEDLPPLAAWLAEHRQPIDLVVEASRRSRFYLPSPSLLNDEPEPLIGVLLPGAQGTRNAARALAARSMLHLGEGRYDAAWNDALAVHRLGCLASQAPTFVEQLVAMAIHGVAQKATMAILSNPALPPELARQIQSDLAGLDRRTAIEKSIDKVERATGLDAIVYYCQNGGLEDFGVAQFAAPGPGALSIDWNIALLNLNCWYDRIAETARISDYAKRQAAMDRLVVELDSQQELLQRHMTPIRTFVSRNARSELVSAAVNEMLIPAFMAAMTAQDRHIAAGQLIDVAASLAVHRGENGEYPEELEDLVPQFLPQTPRDNFHGAPLVYERTPDGYLLYNLGPNGIDDGGSHEQLSVFQGQDLPEHDEAAAEKLRKKIPAGADDLSIRLPVPAFKLPTPPLSTNP